ncbi:hypothetical protein TRFO_06812 [Tritrichomonas foetus]|uniref:Uncharacterized protein n=1 Tax=Tritrichomonas foetus TaxID=1144522 RepID=A0A1J4K042_9EUKA|nr:hypothetical protein TRFO_06812 [Tritrichomonas foetus]|eukprot:OHT03148.1 hypothetical protein TRFO_06812 [Tritrichomonas foetus]
MCKVYSSTSKDYIRVNVGREMMSQKIDLVWPVRRALDIGAFDITHTYGKVLSHSAVAVSTKRGSVLIEYMGDSHVYVYHARDFANGKPIFMQRGFYFMLDIENGQVPNAEITVRDFANTMADYMKEKSFNTLNHNCHLARYLSMKFYGMESDDPTQQSDKVLSTAFSDIRKKYDHLSIQYRNNNI